MAVRSGSGEDGAPEVALLADEVGGAIIYIYTSCLTYYVWCGAACNMSGLLNYELQSNDMVAFVVG